MRLKTIAAFAGGIAVGFLTGGVYIMIQLMKEAGYQDVDRFMDRVQEMEDL